MNKKIIFFDGDGTLWYPTATKRTKKPFWVYIDEATKDNHLEHLCLTPNVIETLKQLRSKGCYIVLLSTHPQEPEEATRILGNKMSHFALNELFDEAYATAEYPEAKGEKILEILDRLGLKKDEAIMVGDSFRWDYFSATAKGIDAVLIDSSYHQENIDDEPVERKIIELDELYDLIK